MNAYETAQRLSQLTTNKQKNSMGKTVDELATITGRAEETQDILRISYKDEKPKG